MSYIEKSLMPNEKILVDSELHWVVFAWPLIASFCILYFMFHQHIMFAINYVAVALIVYLLGDVLIRYLTTSYVLTDFRVIRKKGLLFIRVWDMSCARVESVQLQQSLLGKILGYGDIIISGVGGDQLVLPTIENPTILREKIFEVIDKVKKDS